MFVISAIAVLLAYTVKGITGFANTLVFSSIMSFFQNNLAITPIEIVLGTPSNIFIAVRERKGFKPSVVFPLAALVITGCIPGALLLKSGNPEIVKLFFGVAITVVGLETFVADRLKLKASRVTLAVIGLAAGVMCGMYGIGGLLVAYVSRTTKTPNEFRANTCFVFILVDIFRTILYIATGIFNTSVFLNALKLAPFMVVGLTIGTILSGKLKAELVRKTIMLFMVLTGISLIITNLIAVL